MGKHNFQEDMSKLMENVKTNWEKISKEAGVLAKKGGKKIQKASSIGLLQLDIVGLNLKKDKLKYDLGHRISTKSESETIEDVAKPILNEMRNIEAEIQNKEKEILKINKKKA